MDDSLFSNAAQAETMPIPRDDGLPDTEDMLFLSSPPRPPFNKDSFTVPPRSDSEAFPCGEEAGPSQSDPDDLDFEMSESDGRDTDTTYQVGANQRRGKKKAPGKNVIKQATKKMPTGAKNATHTASTTMKSKGSKEATTTKVGSQKADTKSKEPPKRNKKIENIADMQTAAASTSAHSAVAPSRTSRRSRGGNKGGNIARPGKIIPNSQPLPARKYTRLEQPTGRLPKKSFYNELDDPLAQLAQSSNNDAEFQLAPNTMSDNKQGVDSQDHADVASPIGKDDDDLWHQSESPKNHDHNLQPESQLRALVSPGKPNAAVGPNSKKKRSPVQSGVSKKTKKSTSRTYGQKTTQNSGNSKFFYESKDREARLGERPDRPKHPKDQNIIPSARNASVVLNEAEISTRSKKDEGEIDKHISAEPIILEDALPMTTNSDRESHQIEDVSSVLLQDSILPKPAETSVQGVPENQLSPAVPVKNTTTGEARRTTLQPLTVETSGCSYDASKDHDQRIHMSKGPLENTSKKNSSDNQQAYVVRKAPDKDEEMLKEVQSRDKSSTTKQLYSHIPAQDTSSSQRETHTSDLQQGKGNVEVYVDQLQEPSTSTNDQLNSYNEANRRKHHDDAPPQITGRSMVSELGSPLQSSNIATSNLGRNPLQELHQAFSHKDQYKIPAENQKPLVRKSQQISSDSEPKLPRAGISLPTGRTQSHAHSLKRSSRDTKDSEDCPPTFNTESRIFFSPGTNAEYSVHDPILQAPQLHPRSVDFARRVVQDQNPTGFYGVSGQQKIDGMRHYQPAKYPSWLQSEVITKPQNDLKLAPSSDIRSVNFLGEESFRGRGSRRNQSTQESGREARWQEAVHAASSGVVDTLHTLSKVSGCFRGICKTSVD